MIPMNFRSQLLFLTAALGTLLCAGGAPAQAPKGAVSEDDPPPALTYHGLIPGLHDLEKVEAVLGKPEDATRWYNYKLYYPAEDRPGYFDIVHLHGSKPNSGLACVEAATVPEGYETERAIREALGDPEYVLRMATYSMLDYGEKGVRFTVDADGNTNGVAYVPHLYRRVPDGERDIVNIRDRRVGPQPKPARPASLGGLEAGASEVVITPAKKEWMAGEYEVVDDLKARIAVFREDGLTVAFVGADLFGMGWNEVAVIREGAHAHGVDYTIFGMSHNHAAPDTIGVYGHYPAEYNAFIQETVIAGIGKAVDNLQPVTAIRAASREMPMDGTRVQHLIRNARNPGIMDPTVSMVQAIGEDGAPITTIVHFACHTESIEAGAKEMTADFPGYMCDQIAADGGGQPVFLNGALGGMISGDNRERTHESSKETGLAFAAIVKELMTEAQPPATFEFQAERRDLYIPMVNPRFAPLYESGLRSLERGRVKTDMIYVTLGEAQFITLPGELLPEISFEILEHMDGYPQMLVGLGNDQLGYMIPPYDFRDDYYEETMSQGPAAGTQVRDMAIRMLKAND